jgi:hypothetical protein
MPPVEVRVFREADGTNYIEDWLDDLENSEPLAHQKCLAVILMLEEHGSALRRPYSGALGDGIFELRTRVGTVNYRILYFFSGRHAVLSHGLTKEDKVPKSDIARAVRRRKLVQANPARHIAEWED